MFEFNHTVRIVAGVGAFEESGNIVSAFGRKAMIACDSFAVMSGLANKLSQLLSESDIQSVVYDKVVPNPTTDIVDAGGELAREESCDIIIGIGGGSSIDTAKAIAVAASHEGSIWSYAIGDKQATDKTLPIIAITTTSGTGSQCTPFAVITNPETNQKPGFGGPFLFPKVAIVDPLLTSSMPPQLTAITGADVFTHAVEAYTSKWSSPVVDMYARRAIELVADNLHSVYKNGNDLQAREAMAIADTFGGIAISHGGVTVAHVLAHVIGGHYHNIAHGDALNTIYPAMLEINKHGMKEKHQWIAQTLSGGKNDDVVEAYNDFFGQIDFPNKLKEYNPDNDKIQQMASEVFSYMELYATLGPVEVDKYMIAEALQIAVK
ncbi:MAG: iron-containing alcohol dehydrogenase [Sedimentisphaeraceae bacterium JB056]